MNSLLSFFTQLGKYTVPVILLLIEAVMMAVLIVGFIKLRTGKKNEKQRGDGKRRMQQALTEAGADVGSAFLLLRRSDAMPVFVTAGFTQLFDVSFESFCDDIEETDAYIDKETVRRIKTDYRVWDGKQPLFAAFYYQRTSRWIHATAVRTADDCVLFSFIDVTAQEQKCQALQAKLEEAELESRSKTAFLSKMSHEIRTPMNGMIGLLSLIKMNVQNDPQTLRYIEKTEGLSQFLLSLINDILDMSRIEAGKVELAQERIDIYALAEKLRIMFQKTIEEKHVRFLVEVLDFDARYVIGDELRITQVLINFISNAVKFTSEGEIRVTFRQMQRVEDMLHLMVRVRDTGKGISPEFLQRIFQPFEQENAGIAQKYGGSGLGMAIADQLVHLMDGEIVVDSRLGEGSDFTVYLRLPVAEENAQEGVSSAYPAHIGTAFAGSDTGMSADTVPEEAAADGEAAEHPTPVTLRGLRILMAEDNEINAEIAVAIFETMGASVDVAADGNEVVNMFAGKEKGYYDVILMDIQMPVRNGWEAAGLIRAMKVRGGDSILMYALSADAFVEDKRHSIEIGMDGHFSKPIDFEEVEKTIGEAVAARRRAFPAGKGGGR